MLLGGGVFAYHTREKVNGLILQKFLSIQMTKQSLYNVLKALSIPPIRLSLKTYLFILHIALKS